MPETARIFPTKATPQCSPHWISIWLTSSHGHSSHPLVPPGSFDRRSHNQDCASHAPRSPRPIPVIVSLLHVERSEPGLPETEAARTVVPDPGFPTCARVRSLLYA